MKKIFIFLPLLLLSCSHTNESYKYSSDIDKPTLEIRDMSLEYNVDQRVFTLQGELYDTSNSRSLYEIGYYKDNTVYFLVGNYQGKEKQWITERMDSSDTRVFSLRDTLYFSFSNSDTLSGDQILKIRATLYEDLDIEISEISAIQIRE
ncbi:MAG: hypothetical protein JJ958_11855 [Balneola sp.]|nr:hypothetical protein [Balneola sp.]